MKHFVCTLSTTLLLGLALAISFLPAIWAESLEEFTYDSKGKRDPFIPWKGETPKDAEMTALDDFQVEGIIYDPVKGSMAIVNGTVIKEGDTLDTYRVAKIDKRTVFLSRKGQTVPLHLEHEESSEDELLRGSKAQI